MTSQELAVDDGLTHFAFAPAHCHTRHPPTGAAARTARRPLPPGNPAGCRRHGRRLPGARSVA
ncbi:hypothetical protein Q3H58_003022 [Pseudomonas psychrotolerans]|nr:hypothetical protein [Pseudomonas psychrotolerans]